MSALIHKILIAIDNTPSAMHTANYAIALSKPMLAKVGVIYVTEHNLGNIEAGVEKALQQRHDVLLDEINILHPEIELEEFDPVGKPETEIQNVVALWKPDLLVIGHHTHRFFQKMLGHNTEKHLIKHIKVPLLIIPESFHYE